MMLSSALGSALHAEGIDLKNFRTDNGICEYRQEKKLNEAYLNSGHLSFQKTYTVKEAEIDVGRGSSPPTGRKIQPLEAVNCLFQANNKILVTTVGEMEKSCGWVDEEDLAKTKGSAFSSMGPCGFIEPLSIGDFCKKTSEMVNLDIDTRIILEGCKLSGVRSSNIDTKFVTDNTTSRLSGAIEAGDVVRRQIPVYSSADADQASGSIDVFSLTAVYDVKQKKNGKVAILLGVDQRITGWTELQFGHIWYSNLSTYFNAQGAEPVYFDKIVDGPSGQPTNAILALKPAEVDFNVTSDYAKFPVLFDRRKKYSSSLPNHVPQLQIAFIGKFCDSDDAATLCAEQTNERDEFQGPNFIGTGNIKTAEIGEDEANWDYFIALPTYVLIDLKHDMQGVCFTLGSGSGSKAVETMALRMVTSLTGDTKTPAELVQIFSEGSIPLQTETIIGSGIRDLIVKMATNQELTAEKKEFCRSAVLLEMMLKNRKVGNPEQGEDLVWDGSFYDYKNEFEFNWFVTFLGTQRIYVPLAYLPRL